MAGHPVPAPRGRPGQGPQHFSHHEYERVPDRARAIPPGAFIGSSRGPNPGPGIQAVTNPSYNFHDPLTPPPASASDTPPPLPPKPGSFSRRRSDGRPEASDPRGHGVPAMHSNSFPAHSQPPESQTQGTNILDYPATAGQGMFTGNRQQPRPNSAYLPGRQNEDETHRLRMALGERDRNISIMDQEIATLHSQLTRCQDENHQIQGKLAEKKERMIHLERQIADLQSENEVLRQTNAADSLMGQPSHTEQALLEDVRRLRQQLTASEEEKERLRANSFHRQAPPPPLPLNHPVATQDVQELRQRVEEDQREKARLRMEVEGLTQRVAVLNHQVVTYNEDFQSERSDRERAHHQIHALKEENESLVKAITMLAAEHNIQLDVYGLAPPVNPL